MTTPRLLPEVYSTVLRNLADTEVDDNGHTVALPASRGTQDSIQTPWASGTGPRGWRCVTRVARSTADRKRLAMRHLEAAILTISTGSRAFG